MKIKQFQITLTVDLEIGDIHWENNSIGCYEYGSAKEFDKQQDYIESFEIDEIIIDHSKIEQKPVFDFISNLLMEDEELIERVGKLANEEAEEAKVERALAAKGD